MEGCEKLIVWQKSMDLVVEIYRLAKLLPNSELYGLYSQMSRSAVSIPSNIAEGYTRNTTKDYIRFLYVSRASAAELRTQLTICNRVGFLSTEDTSYAFSLLDEVGKLLTSIVAKLTEKTIPQNRIN